MSKSKMKKLVIVESPTKAKTICRFLGADYMVESCMGHIRDLPSSSKEIPANVKKKPWARFGVNLDEDFSPIYCIPSSKKDVVKKLKSKLKSAGELILATDEDREGESISWHLTEILKPTVPVKRMVFHEITKPAIKAALDNFRSVDNHLVQAQEARRILDRLVGYSISPLLWKKISPGLSAGRVQSVAVSLISRRELERLAFKQTLYWDLSATHKKNSSATFKSRLIQYKNKQLIRSADFDSITGERKKSKTASSKILLMDEKMAQACVKEIKGKKFIVSKVEKKQVSRKPSPPFITSTLQQECNRKFRFSSRQTMSCAQKLYEQGLITYMRTDSTFLSEQALKTTRATVARLYGKDQLPATSRVFRKKARGAQEAHEAIRPTDFVEPSKISLQGDLSKLYELIWKRTLASQMKDCIQNQARIEMTVDSAVFLTSGVTIEFLGFYEVYKDQKTEETPLPPMKKGDEVSCLELEASKHETKPPARYTEASLIQKLEKEGVGRPSTYSSIIGTVQERGYVKKEKNMLIPTFTALVVDRFLSDYFPDYVNMEFTSKMETDLDAIARGSKNHVKYLNSVYFGPKGLKKLVEDQEKQLKDKNFRSLTLKGFEDYSFNVGRFGAYVSKKKKSQEVSASLPPNVYPGEVTKEMVDKLIKDKLQGGRLIGKHPDVGTDIFLVIGRFGPYVEMEKESDETKSIKKKSDSDEGAKKNPANTKRVSLKPFYDENNITLEGAVQLLELPKTLGMHPDTKKEVKKSVGRFGPYIVHDSDFRSVPPEDFFDCDLKAALEMLKQEKKSRGSQVIKDLGKHPKSDESVQVIKGKYGAYIKHKGKNYSLPAGVIQEDLTMEKALEIMDQSATKKRTTTKGKKTSRKKVSARRKS